MHFFGFTQWLVVRNSTPKMDRYSCVCDLSTSIKFVIKHEEACMLANLKVPALNCVAMFCILKVLLN
jgi:hypothetical protein